MDADNHSNSMPSEPLAGAKIWLRLKLAGLLHLWLRRLRFCAGNMVKLYDYENPELRSLRQNILRRHAKSQEVFYCAFAPYYRWCPGCQIPCCVVHASYCAPGMPIRSPFSPLDALIQGEPPTRITHDFKEWQRGEIGQKLKKLGGAQGKLPSREPAATFHQCLELGPGGCRLPWGRRSDVCILPLCETFAAHMSWRHYGGYMWACLRYMVHAQRSIHKICEHAPARCMS